MRTPSFLNRTAGSRHGAALLVAVMLTVLFLAFSAALMGVSLAHSTDSLTASENVKALMAAEAGLHEAIADLNRGGPGNVTGQVGGIAFDARAVRADDRFIVDSVGSNQQFSRAVRTVVVPALPIPVNRAAITIVGPAGSASALDTETSSNRNVLISGMSGGLPAVGVEDPDTYTTLMEDLIPKIVSGAVSENTFRGTPDVSYTASTGETAEVPILPMPTPEWDAEKLELLRTRLVDKTETSLIPGANRVYGPGSTHFTTPTTLGPGITVIDGASLQANSNINGSGTLVIRGGSLEVTNNNQFHWDGTVILLGASGGGAKFLNNGGTVTIQGNVIALGNDGSAADLVIASASGNSNTLINGAVMLMAGAAPNDTAHFEVGSGGVNMHGWVGIFGGTAQFKATNAQGVFNVLGSVSVGVDGSQSQDGYAEVDFDGNVHVQFNQNHLDRAVAGLLGFIEDMMLPPPTYRMQGWMEISPLLAYAPPAQALAYQSSEPPASAGGAGNGYGSSPDTGGQGGFKVGGGKGKGNGK